MVELRIVNLVVVGRFDLRNERFSRRDYERLIEKGRLVWLLANEEISPVLNVKVVESGRKVHVCVWNKGAFQILGLRSMVEAERVCGKVFDELKRLRLLR